ncbi:MAG: hypothetical protein C0502_06705 [Opitutus sp.]|nr:hypothetical protein [Opitutus sp.]
MSRPPVHPQRPAEAAVRFCLSCAGTLACWCVWIVLGIGLVFQLYSLFARELPVPPFVLARLQTKLAEERLAAAFDRAQFDPSGRLLLEKVRLRVAQFEDPLVFAETAYARKSPWSILSGARTPDEIRLTGATLQLPAPLSPTGRAEPLLRDAALTLRIDGSLVHLDQLAFRVGPLAVTVQGDFQLPPRPGGAERPPFGEAVARALQLGRRLARELPRLDCLDRPVLVAKLSVRPGIGNVAELEFTADAVRQPGNLALVAGPFHATTVVRLDGEERRPLRVAFETDRVAYGDRLAASLVSGVIAADLAFRAPAVPPELQLSLAAQRVETFGQTAVAPVLALRWRKEGPLDFSLGLNLHGEPMAVAGVLDPVRRSGRIDCEGTVPPSLAAALLPARAPRLAPYLRLLDPVHVVAAATFSEGGRFERLRSRVRGGRLDSNGVQVTATRGRIDVGREGSFLAHDAFVAAGRNQAAGSYWMNFRSWDYRFLLEGALQPPDIAGWFRSNWWLKFWENIRFPAAAPDADVDVLGNWRDATRTAYFGRTDARNAVVLGADFEQAHARVFVRPHFAHAFDLRVTRGGGAQQASGWFKRIADAGTRELRAYEFDLTGNLDAASLRHLGGPTADTLLRPWQFSTPPSLVLTGRADFAGGKAKPDLTFTGSAGGPVSYEGFPLEGVSAKGGVSGPDVRLDRIELALAGGHGAAKAALNGEGERQRLGFDFYLESADLVRAIRAINDYEAARAPAGTPPVSPNQELLKRASGGRLNFALSAQGRPGDLASFNGSGNLGIAGAELGEVHLFGLLSQLLSGLSLNFSSLKLNSLRGSYRVADGRVSFPDIRVTGPTALIEGRGDYRLTDKTLDFTARFKPYEENRNLLTGVIGIVMNPLASILELRLTGPIQKPNWSVSLGSGAPRENTPVQQPNADSPATPAPTPENKRP